MIAQARVGGNSNEVLVEILLVLIHIGARSFNMEWFLWNYSSWNDRLIYTNVDQLE